MSFEALQIKKEIVRALREQSIITPTPIQAKSIPLILEGRNVISISKTGSGKTACFGVPILEKVIPRGGIQCLILTPTRELANQISGEFQKWSKYLNLKIATVFGGVSMGPQIRDMARAEIFVGTPGRTLDHLSSGNLNLSNVQIFVLDEADKMVEMGMIEDVERILSATPRNRQILLFGATISNEIDYLKQKYMGDVAVAQDEVYVKEDLLKQCYYNVSKHQKFSLLVHLLKTEQVERAIIFCSKRSTVELLNKNLHLQGIKSDMIHGKMRQNKRLFVIDRFNQGKIKYLVASSVAARGLDIKDVTHVFNYDLSRDPQEYIHRVGRTARAGESGKAITLLSEQDHDAFRQIFRRYDVNVEETSIDHFPMLRFEMEQADHSFDRRHFSRRPHRSRHHTYN